MELCIDISNNNLGGSYPIDITAAVDLPAYYGAGVAAVHVKGRLYAKGGGFMLDSRLGVGLNMPCSLCLTPVAIELDFEHNMAYMLGDEDYGELINLAPAIVGAIAALLPMKPLCKEGCLGLCHYCGSDLNIAPCSCKAEQEDNVFTEALKIFRKE